MSEVSKFRCMVYGCTIPAGIFHEHPADAPVMRDPSGPLDAYERALLEAYRHVPIKDIYMVPVDAKIHGSRKLTQALLEAGRPHREGADVGVVLHQAPEPRRSFVSLKARIAFWIVLAVTVAIWIFAGVKS